MGCAAVFIGICHFVTHIMLRGWQATLVGHRLQASSLVQLGVTSHRSTLVVRCTRTTLVRAAGLLTMCVLVRPCR